MNETEKPRRSCYASALGGCGGGLTLEHYVSAAILRRLNVENGLAVREPRYGAQAKLLPPEALGARMLCQVHNNALSPLDAEALRFFDLIEGGFALATKRGKLPDVAIDGELLERWALKVLAGLVASGRAGPEREVPRDWLEVLYGLCPPGVGCGLFWVTEPKALRGPSEGRGVSVSSMVLPERGVQGVHLDVNSVNLFYFAEPVRTDHRAQRHPVRFKLRHEESNARFDVRLRWRDPPRSKTTVQVSFANASINGRASAS